MKFTSRTLLSIMTFFAAQSLSFAYDINLQYGSAFDDPTAPTIYSVFGDEEANAFDNTNANALIAYGFFADGFDVQSNADDVFSGSITLSSFLSNYTELDSAVFTGSSATFKGMFQVTPGNVSDKSGEGKTGYLITLTGPDVTDWSSAGSAEEIGIFRNTSWDPIPAEGTAGLPADHIVDAYEYQSIIAGSRETLSNYLGFGVDAHMFKTQAVQAVPEPSTYAMMLGALSFGFVYYKRRIAGKKAEQQKQEA